MTLFCYQHRLRPWQRALEVRAKDPSKYSETWGLSKNSLIVVWAGKPYLHKYWQISIISTKLWSLASMVTMVWVENRQNSALFEWSFWRPYLRLVISVKASTRNMLIIEHKSWGPNDTCRKVVALQFGKSHNKTHNFTLLAKSIGPTTPKSLTMLRLRKSTTRGLRLKGKYHRWMGHLKIIYHQLKSNTNPSQHLCSI